MITLLDFKGRRIQLSSERLKHILKRPEMWNQLPKIRETLRNPLEVRKSKHDSSVHLYYKKYSHTPVSEKFLLVVVKIETESPFVITAFFTDRIKSGKRV